jgi:hypothetical protein
LRRFRQVFGQGISHDGSHSVTAPDTYFLGNVMGAYGYLSILCLTLPPICAFVLVSATGSARLQRKSREHSTHPATIRYQKLET